LNFKHPKSKVSYFGTKAPAFKIGQQVKTPTLLSNCAS